MPAYALIGDIGGTNARLAVCNVDTGKISNIQQFLTCDYPTFEAVIARFMHENPLRLQYACLAIASPSVENGSP